MHCICALVALLMTYTHTILQVVAWTKSTWALLMSVVKKTRALQSAYPTCTLHLWNCSAAMSDDPYQATSTCAHGQKTHGLQWARSMGVATMANNYMLFVTLMGCAEWFEACLGEFFIDFIRYTYDLLSCLHVGRSGNFSVNDRQTEDRQDQLLHPLCMRTG